MINFVLFILGKVCVGVAKRISWIAGRSGSSHRRRAKGDDKTFEWHNEEHREEKIINGDVYKLDFVSLGFFIISFISSLLFCRISLSLTQWRVCSEQVKEWKAVDSNCTAIENLRKGRPTTPVRGYWRRPYSLNNHFSVTRRTTNPRGYANKSSR